MFLIIYRTPLSITRLCIKTRKSSGIDENFDQYRAENYDQSLHPSIQTFTLLQNLGKVCPHIQYLTIPGLPSAQLNVLQQTFQELPYLAHLYIGEIKVG